jgi:hypothetical protein
MRRLDHHISAVAQYAMRSSNGPVTWRDYIMVLNLGSANGSESSRVVYKLWHYLLYRPFGADLYHESFRHYTGTAHKKGVSHDPVTRFGCSVLISKMYSLSSRQGEDAVIGVFEYPSLIRKVKCLLPSSHDRPTNTCTRCIKNHLTCDYSRKSRSR